MKTEIFLPIFDGRYLVSDQGRVRSLVRKDRILKPSTSTGYCYVSLYLKKGERTIYPVHQLVAIAFLSHDPKSGLVIDHKNDNPLDNRAENLQIVSNRFNVIKGRIKTGLLGTYRTKKGKWVATIHNDGKKRHLGTFEGPLGASLAYQMAYKRITGEPLFKLVEITFTEPKE